MGLKAPFSMQYGQRRIFMAKPEDLPTGQEWFITDVKTLQVASRESVSHRRKPSRERSGSGKFSLVALDARKI
jgi:hypothetical protein